jgi:hypothetical protein
MLRMNGVGPGTSALNRQRGGAGCVKVAIG